MFLFFMILELYGMSLITFAWIITPFFQKAQTAGGLASMASMVTSLLYLVVSMTRTVTSTGEVTYTIPPVGRGFLSLLSPCCVALAIDQVKERLLSTQYNMVIEPSYIAGDWHELDVEKFNLVIAILHPTNTNIH